MNDGPWKRGYNEEMFRAWQQQPVREDGPFGRKAMEAKMRGEKGKDTVSEDGSTREQIIAAVEDRILFHVSTIQGFSVNVSRGKARQEDYDQMLRELALLSSVYAVFSQKHGVPA